MKEQLLQTGYTWGRQVVLRCQARYPQLEAGELPGFEGVLSQYYAAYARDKINNLARGWYPAACASCRRMGPYGGFSPLEAQCEYTVMYNLGGYYSAFFDTYVRQDGRDLAAGRQSGVFWTGAGRMVPLSALFRPGYPYRQVILRCVQEETARQAGRDPGAFYVDWPTLVNKGLDERNYYLADDGLVIYYPRRALGPSSTGLPSFLIPYAAFGSGLGPEL